MSVLACDRRGCRNVMCNRIILQNTCYICNECYEELLAYKAAWPPSTKASDVKDLILVFMKSLKGSYRGECKTVDEVFEELVPKEPKR